MTTLVRTEATASRAMLEWGAAMVASFIGKSDDVLVMNTGDIGVRSLHISNDKMRVFAATRNPPQSWYDEDMEGMY